MFTVNDRLDAAISENDNLSLKLQDAYEEIDYYEKRLEKADGIIDDLLTQLDNWESIVRDYLGAKS